MQVRRAVRAAGRSLRAGALLLAALLALPASLRAQAGEDYRERRLQMVRSQIASRGFGEPVTDSAVLAAMRAVPRHRFVPAPLREVAYRDRPLPIGHGATISQPYIVARMTELVRPSPGDTVFELGTGSGYQAAVLAEIVGHVYTVEIVGALARSARGTLEALGYDNVTVKHGDGTRGWPEHAPFDGILVTAAAPEIPEPLVQQLARGGRMVIPVGPRGQTQSLVLLEKNQDGSVDRRTVMAVRFVPVEH